MSVPRQALEFTSVEKDVDRLGRHGCRRGHGAVVTPFLVTMAT